MKKQFLIAGIILTMLFFLCSCETSPPPSTTTEPQHTQVHSTGDSSAETSVEEPSSTQAVQAEMDPEFRQLGEELIDRFWPMLTSGRENWFDEYNGETLQRIDMKETGEGAAQASDIIFYHADAGDTLDEILYQMMVALYEPFFSPAEDRAFTITRCFIDIPNQEILNGEEMADELIGRAWTAWNSEMSYHSQRECIIYTIYESFIGDGLMPVGDNMWLLPAIEGYYKYDGKDRYTFDEYMKLNGATKSYELLPFVREGDGKDFSYLLVKQEDVYRLQRVADMGIAIPEYYGEGDEIPEEFCALADAKIDQKIKKIETMKESWFAEYNGEEIQLISVGERKFPGCTDDIVFYRASEGEKIEEVVVKMVDALMEPFFIKEASYTFVMTDYFLDMDEQEIYTSDEVREKLCQNIWMGWKNHYPGSDAETYIQNIVNSPGVLYLISENMWELPHLEGYYKYEGDALITYESALKEAVQSGGKYAESGFVPFHYTMDITYILVKEGEVYRLQLASKMGL